MKENLSAKEEFAQVNPCRECDKKPLGQESFKENLSAKEEFTQVNPCREYERKSLYQGRIHLSESLPRVRKYTCTTQRARERKNTSNIK